MGNKFVVTYNNVSNFLKEKTHAALDFFSTNLCQDKPSYKLATDNLHIPEEDLTILMQVLNLVRDMLGLAIVPFQMLIDKKFSIHIYEQATVFVSPNNPAPQNIISTSDKMLIYIAQNRNKIIEPASKQIIKTITIDHNDYDLPVNFWYTFDIDNTHKVYIFVHVSVIQNYKGVVIAANAGNEANLPLMKDKAMDHYNHTLGLQQLTYAYNAITMSKKMDFL